MTDVPVDVPGRWMAVIVVRPPPCPAGQQMDMLGLCRPVVGSSRRPQPLPVLLLSEFGGAYRDYSPHASPERPARLAGLDNTVNT